MQILLSLGPPIEKPGDSYRQDFLGIGKNKYFTFLLQRLAKRYLFRVQVFLDLLKIKFQIFVESGRTHEISLEFLEILLNL